MIEVYIFLLASTFHTRDYTFVLQFIYNSRMVRQQVVFLLYNLLHIQARTIKELSQSSTGIVVLGDRQCDSLGKCAKFCTYIYSLWRHLRTPLFTVKLWIKGKCRINYQIWGEMLFPGLLAF